MLGEILSDLLYRLRALVRRQRLEGELDEELRFHFERQVEKNIARGMPQVEARRQASLALGGIDQVKEECREARGFALLEAVARDLGYAVRGLRRSPALSLSAALTIAIGVGAATGMFSIMRRLLLAPPPHVAAPDRVFRLHQIFPDEGSSGKPFTQTSYPFYELLAGQATSLDNVTAYADADLAVGSGTDAHMAHSVMVSAGFWRTLGVQPALGRFLSDDEAHPATGARVAVLGHAYWQRRFGGRSDALQDTIRIKSQPYQIVGVAPRGFRGVELADVDLWLPLFAWGDGEKRAITWHKSGSSYILSIVMRLKPNVTAEQASAELTHFQRAFYVNEYADVFRDPKELDRYRRARALLGPVTGGLGEDMRPIPEARVTVWLVAIAFVLLAIACSNVAGLLLLRAMRRRREIAVRLAFGVSRGRLASQLLTESAVLAAPGGVAVLLMVIAGGAWVQRALLPALAWESAGLLDPRVVGVAALCIFGATFVAGVAPLSYARSDVMSFLRDGTSGGPPRQSRSQAVLLVLQGALSVLLLVGAGLFLRSLHNAETADIGLEREETLVAEMDFSGTGRSKAQIHALFEAALERVSTLPGVQHAALAVSVPLRWMMGGGSLELPGRSELPEIPTGGPYVNCVTPGFFAATGMNILEGRSFLEQERDSGRAIVVNETMARLYWPGQSPVGKCVSVSGLEGCTSVVGVVADSRRFKIVEDEAVLYYYRLLPSTAEGKGCPSFGDDRALLLRQAPGIRRMDGAIRQVFGNLEPGLPYLKIETLGEALDPEIRPWRLGATVFTAFGILATILAMVGLWSSVAYAVSQRTREFAIRKAIGADNRSLVGMMLRDGVRNSVVAVATGLLIAGMVSPLIAGLLFEVDPRDYLVFAVVGVVTVTVATFAILPAAWRASRIEPASALRAD
jgi:predicted permease